MTDELKLGLYSVRDDTSILDIQSSDLNAYIFSTRDDPSVFIGNGGSNGRVVIFDGNLTNEDYEFDTESGQYGTRIDFSECGYLLEPNVTRLFVTLNNGKEIVFPKNIYNNIPVTFYGEYNVDDDLPDFTNYPILFVNNVAEQPDGLIGMTTAIYSHIKIEALESEVTVAEQEPEPIPIGPQDPHQ